VRLSDFHLHQIGGSQSVVSLASVNPYSWRSFFHLSAQRYPPRMGSHGRRQPETRMVPVLVCRSCGGLTSSARFSYLCERLFCDHCGAENPQTNVRAVQTRDIFVRFITADGCSVQAVDLNLEIARLAHACPLPAQRSCAGSWPTWAPCPKRSKSSTNAVRVLAEATCASC
jgi:ribosomal protein L40E